MNGLAFPEAPLWATTGSSDGNLLVVAMSDRRLLGVDLPAATCEALGMAFDEELAERIRAVLGDEEEVAEQKMFGGLAFLLRRQHGLRGGHGRET